MDNNTPNEPRLAESLRRTVERRKELLSTADRIEADLHFGEKISAQTMVSDAAILMKTALGKAAERIVVLESLLESERKVYQKENESAIKNATYL